MLYRTTTKLGTLMDVIEPNKEKETLCGLPDSLSSISSGPVIARSCNKYVNKHTPP
jgi:hypothetical protein